MYFNESVLYKLFEFTDSKKGLTSVDWRMGAQGPGFYIISPRYDKEIYLDSEQEVTFDMAVAPLMLWLKRNHNPHTRIFLDSGCAELLSGEKCYYFKPTEQPKWE